VAPDPLRGIARTARTHAVVRAPIARNTRILACSRSIARWHRRCHLATPDGTDVQGVRIAMFLEMAWKDSQDLRGALRQRF
jgi:hypothetical protein